MFVGAKRLVMVDIAIKAHMKMFAVEREISRYWTQNLPALPFLRGM